MNLHHYLQDGANAQARCVLILLQQYDMDFSWNKDTRRSEAEPKVARWHNTREQGYVVSMRNKKRDQINIAFFEHRNNPDICAVSWVQETADAPNFNSAEFGDIYKNCYDYSHFVGYHQFEAMAIWIFNQLKAHWEAGLPDTNK